MQGTPVWFAGVDQIPALLDGERARHLDGGVLATLHPLHRHGSMPFPGRGDDETVQVLPRHQAPEVFLASRVTFGLGLSRRLDDVLGLRHLRGVDVAKGGHLRSQAHKDLQQAGPANADTPPLPSGPAYLRQLPRTKRVRAVLNRKRPSVHNESLILLSEAYLYASHVATESGGRFARDPLENTTEISGVGQPRSVPRSRSCRGPVRASRWAASRTRTCAIKSAGETPRTWRNLRRNAVWLMRGHPGEIGTVERRRRLLFDVADGFGQIPGCLSLPADFRGGPTTRWSSARPAWYTRRWVFASRGARSSFMMS